MPALSHTLFTHSPRDPIILFRFQQPYLLPSHSYSRSCWKWYQPLEVMKLYVGGKISYLGFCRLELSMCKMTPHWGVNWPAGGRTNWTATFITGRTIAAIPPVRMQSTVMSPHGGMCEEMQNFRGEHLFTTPPDTQSQILYWGVWRFGHRVCVWKHAIFPRT